MRNLINEIRKEARDNNDIKKMLVYTAGIAVYTLLTLINIATGDLPGARMDYGATILFALLMIPTAVKQIIRH